MILFVDQMEEEYPAQHGKQRTAIRAVHRIIQLPDKRHGQVTALQFRQHGFCRLPSGSTTGPLAINASASGVVRLRSALFPLAPASALTFRCSSDRTLSARFGNTTAIRHPSRVTISSRPTATISWPRPCHWPTWPGPWPLLRPSTSEATTLVLLRPPVLPVHLHDQSGQ